MTTSPTLAANPFVGVAPETAQPLPATDRFPAAGHLWSQPELDALTVAWAARRPLLVRGEAGSGKSQIARAAAAVLGLEPGPLVEVIHPRFEALDLLYRVDLVARLADAQIANRLDPTNERYVSKGCLWQAFEALDAEGPPPVLLIDEIDKADADLPNALLDVLGNRSFPVPPLHRPDAPKIVAAQGKRLPLVIITTNEERELPAAFVRRCAVLNLAPPPKTDTFIAWLVARGRVHDHLDITEDARKAAAAQVLADRQAAQRAGYPSVGLAEYIDLLTALHELTHHEPKAKRAKAQMAWLERVGAYVLVKHAGQRQDRTPATAAADPA